MNLVPVKEIAQVSNSFMDIMRRQPLSLALVVMNLALLFFSYIIIDKTFVTREHEFVQIQAAQKEVRNLLANCIVPGSQ